MRDLQYKDLKFHPSEMPHEYGKNIHILSDPYLMLGLTHLCSEATEQPLLHYWIGKLYRAILQSAVNQCFDRTTLKSDTRMKAYHPEGVIEAEVTDPESRVVVVNLARAGIVPSFYCYDELNYFLKPKGVRQDHILMSRTVDSQEKVTGSSVGGIKIGGSIDGSYVLIPDPMGATGSTISTAINAYKNYGSPKKWIAMHLIITPEYIAHIQKTHPYIEVFALRLDRGLSSEKVLKSPLGRYKNEERGLNDKHYIVPGAGGLGEILNNAFV